MKKCADSINSIHSVRFQPPPPNPKVMAMMVKIKSFTLTELITQLQALLVVSD